MRLKNGFACILSALMICAAVGCGRRTDSGDKSEVKGGEHVKSGIQYQKAPVLTGSSEVYSVMDFGAVGNGRADDTQAIMSMQRDNRIRNNRFIETEQLVWPGIAMQPFFNHI